MRYLLASAAALGVLASQAAAAVVLVETNDPGYLNESIGTLLNGTSAAFPVVGDPVQTFGPGDEPDLSAADAVLGDWLSATPDFTTGSGWSDGTTNVPSTWAVNTEIAFVYQFDTAGATNVIANFGVDNGIFVWLDGVFLGGAMQPGGVSLGEHTFDVGDLNAGTHYLQVLLEDHGSTNGFAVEITADEFLPPEPPTGVPAPGGLALVLAGLGALGAARRRFD